MPYVYILESENSAHWYVGMTNDLTRRLLEHNSGKNIHTRGAAWSLKTYIWFHSREKAFEFERYLKSHSGRAFAKKRL